LCGYENFSDDKFCSNCGEQLARVPKNIKQTAAKIESERKNVTVLFSDISGYTHITKQMDPEEVKEITHRIFDKISWIVGKYDGFVERVFGDEVLVYFGVPKSYEDHPVRAILAAMEIHSMVEAMSHELEEKTGRQLRMHTGINTGLVVTGNTDARKGKDGFAGQAINIASRLVDLAGPGEILAGSDTYRRAAAYFNFEFVKPEMIGGTNENIAIYRVIDTRNKGAMFEKAIEQGPTPFAGRDTELLFLQDCFKQFQTDRSTAVSIVAKSGIGKSRLLYEFRNIWANQNVTFLEGKCLSYQRNTPYHSVIDILKSIFDIRVDDRNADIKGKIKKGLKILGLGEASNIPYVYQLLSVKSRMTEGLSLNLEEIKGRIVEVFSKIIIKSAKIKPLIIAIEDLHWIDMSSEEFFEKLLKVKEISDARVMFLFTYRTQYTPPWKNTPFIYEVSLNPLDKQESLLIMESLLGTKDLEVDLENLILEKTSGIPFFIEELIKSLIDRKEIERKGRKYQLVKDLRRVEIPSTIRDVITARMDSLPKVTKELLQKASVVGKEFSYNIIKEVTGLPDEILQTHLSILIKSQLLYLEPYRKSQHFFRHSLIQEVAYTTMLIRKRIETHNKAGMVLEKHYYKKLDQFYELLANHYSKGENIEKAYQYLILSGKKAASRYSNWEAFHFFKSAAEVFNEISENRLGKREKIEALKFAVIPMIHLAYPRDSFRILMKGAELSKELGDIKSLAKFHDIIGNYYTIKGGDPLLGIEHSEKCFDVAEKSRDLEIICKAARGLCGSYIVVGEPLKSAALSEKVINLIENAQIQREHHDGKSLPISVLYALYGHSQGWLGNFEEGKQWAENALLTGRSEVNYYDLAYIYLLYGYIHMHSGDGKNVIKKFEKCIRYCDKGKVVTWIGLGWTGLGMGYFFSGDLKLAKKYMMKGLKIQKDSKIPYYLSFHLLALGLASFYSGKLGHARRYFNDSLEWSKRYGEKWIEGVSKIYFGRIITKTNKYRVEKIEEFIIDGIRILTERKITPWSSIGYYILGEFYADNCYPERAVENLKKATEMFMEMRMDFWLSRAQKALQNL